MAIAFARARYISRSNGGSAVRSAAYNGREAIKSERTSEVFYFKHRDAPDHHEMLLPEDAPSALSTGDALWNAAEAMERRKDAQLAREIVLALPANHELGHDDRVELARSFAIEHFVSKGLAVQLDVHSPHGAEIEGERANFHAHLLITTRRLGADGFATKKARDLDPVIRRNGGRAIVAEGEAWGALWRDHQNQYFAEQGLSIRVEATGVVPQEHIGPIRMRTPGAEANARAEFIRRANEEAARDPDHVLAVLTRNQASFSEYDVDRYLKKHLSDQVERNAVKEKVFGHDHVLGLHDRDTGVAVGRWTTPSVRAQELEALADARRVASVGHHEIGEGIRRHVSSERGLKADQFAVLQHATGAGGLKIVEGRAGTGKSFALGAVREAHEVAGYRVLGLAPTNAVAQAMKDEGFERSSTVHAELFRLKNGRAQWDRRTVIVVDEAAMMDAKVTGEVLHEARLAGVKVILAGDDRQLGSIERGGLFTELRQEHGSAETTQVTRQKVDWQKVAARDLADGRFEDALRAFAGNQAIVWTTKQEELRGKLVEQWARDTAGDRSSSRFVFAYTNKDVDALNKELRAVRRERGELGEDFVFTTKHGEAALSVGDRVQFTDTLKGAGIYNGNAGVITGIDRDFGRISVVLDAAAGRGGRRVEWYASEFNGFRHGYAGTIYKGQGRTLDHTYLLHTHHWRAASSYVALTRQRESATIFVSTETARDLRQLARQIGRNEMKAASVAYATYDELNAEQRQRLNVDRVAARSQFAAVDGREGQAVRPAAYSGAGAPSGEGRAERRPEVETIAPSEWRDGRSEGEVPRKATSVGGGEVPDAGEGFTSADARVQGTKSVLIPPLQAIGPDGVRRDSLGRALDDASVAAAVARNADVQQERQARSIYIETAYRDPTSATQRLDEVVVRDGPTSAAQRVSGDPGLLGELKGGVGFFAGARAREERLAAEQAAAAIGPNIVRTAELENRAAQNYRADVEKQMSADAIPVYDISQKAKLALSAIATAVDDQERPTVLKALSGDREIRRELAAFRNSIEARFGDEGSREMLRAADAGRAFDHPSLQDVPQPTVKEVSSHYESIRTGEREVAQMKETEKLTEQQTQGAQQKP